jgi:hypothetical protein
MHTSLNLKFQSMGFYIKTWNFIFKKRNKTCVFRKKKSPFLWNKILNGKFGHKVLTKNFKQFYNVNIILGWNIVMQ